MYHQWARGTLYRSEIDQSVKFSCISRSVSCTPSQPINKRALSILVNVSLQGVWGEEGQNLFFFTSPSPYYIVMSECYSMMVSFKKYVLYTKNT